MRPALLSLIVLLGTLTGATRPAAGEHVDAVEVMDVEVDPGVEDPRGDAAVAPVDAREEDKMVCTNVVCGDDEVTRPTTCSTCPAR